ncbi:formyltransferase [Rubellicoccus peritrichatus]|uniref:Formyltransferase n=1 Tax=Rubellicoccus peritrichatus TaxID=3080537 RepID=A0AAQ3QSX8_9BACT|nr:formyltransferase [Puniceicoccus sp. CR14]WOO40696.1 formyltransferase [Puniceicoccus sp. CR14]
MTQPRTVVFAYSDVGFFCLKLLLERDCNVVAVFTHEDNPNENQWFSSVAKLAEEHGISVHKPEKLKRSEWESTFLDEIKPELILSFYYRNMIPTWILGLPALGAYNMHGSYLPKYRGRAPVNWAVLHGESYIGATLHVMVKEPDAGEIVDQEKVMIGENDTASEVMERVRDAAVVVLGREIEPLLSGTAPRTPQDESEATYFSGRKPEDGRIDWTQSARDSFNLIRAVTRPYPGAFSDSIDSEKRLLVWWARVLSSEEAAGLREEKLEPGALISSEPLVITCGEGALEVTDFEWIEKP